jgi:hypothetical protein
MGGIVGKKTTLLKAANGAEIQKQIDYIKLQMAQKKGT